MSIPDYQALMAPVLHVLSDGEDRERSRGKSGSNGEPSLPERESADTPEEALETAYRRLRSAIESDLLDHVKRMPPDYFVEE